MNNSMYSIEAKLGSAITHCQEILSVDISEGVLRNVHSQWTSLRVVIHFPVDIFVGTK
jgi:hypothetical protein